MRLATYDALVSWAEQTAASSPSRYRSWVGFFAALGYLVVSATLVLGLILLAVAIAVCVMAVATQPWRAISLALIWLMPTPWPQPKHVI